MSVHPQCADIKPTKIIGRSDHVAIIMGLRSVAVGCLGPPEVNFS